MAKSKVENWLDEMERETAESEMADAGPMVALVPSNEEALSVLWSPQPSDAGQRKTVEEILAASGKLDAEKLMQAQNVQVNSRGKKVTQILHEMAAVGEEDIQRAVAESMGMEYEPIDPKKLDRRAFDYLPSEFMKTRGCCGVRLDEGKLVLGMVDPADVFLLEEIKRKVSVKNVRVVVVCQSHINARHRGGQRGQQRGGKGRRDHQGHGRGRRAGRQGGRRRTSPTWRRSATNRPVIRFVNYLIFDAIKQGASDIHIEPKEKALKIRYRIDGVLFEAMNPPHTMHAGDRRRA